MPVGRIRVQLAATSAINRQHSAGRRKFKLALISLSTQRPIEVFAPQERHVAPMGVKFGMEEAPSVQR